MTESSIAPSTDLSPLLGKSLPELTVWVAEHGQPAYRAKQLYQWLYEKGAR
ncbi:MAG: 23S rRNA (adenine(2503)-C(2))-methyltransferase RlmN, partial [Microcoleaceae cyanobacterium]